MAACIHELKILLLLSYCTVVIDGKVVPNLYLSTGGDLQHSSRSPRHKPKETVLKRVADTMLFPNEYEKRFTLRNQSQRQNQTHQRVLRWGDARK
jgi:hypothetical protein